MDVISRPPTPPGITPTGNNRFFLEKLARNLGQTTDGRQNVSERSALRKRRVLQPVF